MMPLLFIQLLYKLSSFWEVLHLRSTLAIEQSLSDSSPLVSLVLLLLKQTSLLFLPSFYAAGLSDLLRFKMTTFFEH